MLITPATQPRAGVRWGQQLARLGRGCLVVFAAVALINANRQAGLLTFGVLARVSSAVRGSVPVGVAYLLLPVGVALWFIGRPWIRGFRNRPSGWRLGPPVVVAPVSILLALTLAHLSPAIGWTDIAFVLAGLGLLVLAYLFVFLDGPSWPALAGFVALVGSVQALVGVGQFMVQHDLRLSWLGERILDPSVSGMSVLAGPERILRAYGLMRHPNALGAILPLSLMAAISLGLRAGRLSRGLWLAATVVITAGLVLSFSRAGWIAALAGGGVLLAASGFSLGQVRRYPWAVWLPTAGAVAAVVAIAVSLQPGLFFGRLMGIFGAGSVLEQTSTFTRLSALQWAWQIIQRWPLWGVGTRQYVLVVAQLMHVDPSESLLVDSTPAILWAEQGVVALVAWLGLGFGLVWLGCRRAAGRAANPDLALATAWVAAIQVVCVFQAFFWPSLELWQGGIWLGVALGLWARAWSSSEYQSSIVI